MSTKDSEAGLFFVPSVPSDLGVGKVYLQIALSAGGAISVRGSRVALEWFLHRCAATGWVIALDDVHWCG